MIRPTPAALANMVGWAVVLALAAAAIALVLRIGPLGLLLLGLLTMFVCTQFSLNDATPTWGTAVFRARMDRSAAPEQRAAEAANRHANLSPIRFYRWCGAALIVAGLAALSWQALTS